ncbi:MAG: flagellin FliC, partial [Sphingomonadaceae bacterium]|nr:flagellin FliC [Sphingomonadaceae bacterium]
SSKMDAAVQGDTVAIRNANDGISLAQTAESAMGNVANILQRLSELAVESANGTITDTDRSNLNVEVTQLTAQIGDIASKTNFNGQNLLDGSVSGGFQLQVGTAAADTVTMSIDKMDTTTLGINAINLSTQAGATSALTSINSAITSVASSRAKMGAYESRLQSTVNNLTSTVTNLNDSASRIEDADFSAETTNLAKAQILSQAATAMLAQANQSQQSVLKLIQ